MKIIGLSHYLSEESPSYGNRNPFKRRQSSSICCGNSANSEYWEMHNHLGTHVDLPYHFDDEGSKLGDYSEKDWYFESPLLIDIPVESGEIIKIGDWCHKVTASTDMIIFKTGFEGYREQSIYWSKNPGIDADVGIWLRTQFPNVKIIGFDFISLTSFVNRELGIKAHKAFLKKDGPGQPIRILEDMSLVNLYEQPRRVIVAPLLVKEADGAPVTVFAEV